MTRPVGELVYPVAGLLGEVVGSTRDHHVGPLAVETGPDLRLAIPIEGDLHLARTNRGLLVRARLATALAASCSRCLRELEVPLALDIDEEALPSVELTTGDPLDAAAEPDAVRLTDHHELDLEPLVRESILLAEPIAPLCRPDCPGLCAECGANLADPDHRPHDIAVDPRLEALAAFMVSESSASATGEVDEERETD